MAVDTPAKIAILGAGPIGLEAALYARYLGYEVEIFECGDGPAMEVSNRRAMPMFTPFGMNRSSLGLAALKSQDDNYVPPADDAYLTYREWYKAYLQPLAESDLVVDCLRLNVSGLRVGKVEITKSDGPTGEYDRGGWDFRLLVNRAGEESMVTADILFDCSGVRRPQYLGHSGLPALGELPSESAWPTNAELPEHLRNRIHYRPQRQELLTGNIGVVGDDFSAAESIVLLAEAMLQNPKLNLTWLTRHAADYRPHGPLEYDEHDPLPQREKMIRAANELATSGRVTWWPETWIEAIAAGGDKLRVTISGARDETLELDHLLCHNGFVPSHAELSELALDLCPRSGAPRPFAEALWKRKSSLEVDYPASSPHELVTSEPNFYILGAKSFGRLPGFLFPHGLRQIRDVFTIIGDRADLDLYAKY